MLKRFTRIDSLPQFRLFVSDAVLLSRTSRPPHEEKKTEDMAVTRSWRRTLPRHPRSQRPPGKGPTMTEYDLCELQGPFQADHQDNVMTDKIEYRIDDGALAVYQEPFVIDTEGKHIITFFGTDKLGNKED